MGLLLKDWDSKSFGSSLAIWFLWILATSIGLGVANAISFYLVSITVIALDANIGVLGYVLVATVAALVGGPLLALCQMIVLRLPKGARLGWLLLTSLAWLLTAGVVILVLASAVDRNIDIYGLQPVVIAIAGGVWIGAVFGVCQWRSLRHLFAGAGWWIPASILGWIAFFEITIYLSGLPLPQDYLRIVLAGGTMVGMITGAALAGFKSQSGSRLLNTLVLAGISSLLILAPAIRLTQVYNQQQMVLPALTPDDSVWALAFSPDGRMLVTVDGQLSLWDLASGERLRSKSLSTPFQSSLAFSPDGKQVAYGNSGGNQVILWDIESGQSQDRTHPDVNELAFSPDGRTLAIGAGDFDSGGITLWDMTGKGFSKVLTSHEWVRSVAFSPDGKWLASASGNTIYIRDAGTGREIEVFNWKNVGVHDVLFSADGRFLIAGGSSRSENAKTVRVWEIKKRRSAAVQDSDQIEELQILHIARNIEAMAISPDGEILAIAYGILERDPAIYLYEPSSGKLLATLRGHKNPINCLAFSPDGQNIASGSFDGTTRLWDVPILGSSMNTD